MLLPRSSRKAAAHLQHIYSTLTAHLQHIYSTLQHIYSTCTVLFCICVVAAHVLLCTVNVPLLHIYCCSTCAIMCCCRICSGIWRNGRKHQFYRHEVGVGVRFGVGIHEKIMLFSLSFYLFPLFFGRD